MITFRRHLDYRTYCQFCERSSEDLEVLFVREETKVSICNQCAEDAVAAAKDHLEAPGA